MFYHVLLTTYSLSPEKNYIVSSWHHTYDQFVPTRQNKPQVNHHQLLICCNFWYVASLCEVCWVILFSTWNLTKTTSRCHIYMRDWWHKHLYLRGWHFNIKQLPPMALVTNRLMLDTSNFKKCINGFVIGVFTIVCSRSGWLSSVRLFGGPCSKDLVFLKAPMSWLRAL